ncbi:efflux RND transporter periplasmic adaptor subunit [Synechococcus moorigangaii CMS01]|nr:efflux RND transporter periplasmic adaptor subunit [Synechococcus moorigangaii CMS01]
MAQQLNAPIGVCFSLALAFLATGCALEQNSNAQPAGRQERAEQPPLVDVAIAASTEAAPTAGYTGTTMALKTVVVRSRVEGQLLTLNADVGDFVRQGQLLAAVEQDLPLTDVGEAQAELAARQFDVKEAESVLAETKAQVELNRAELKQAEADARRLQQLAEAGAITAQQAEVAQTQQATAAQILKASQEQVITRQQAIAAAKQRVTAQQSILAQTQERLTYTQTLAPQSGVVLSKQAEVGDTLQTGQTLLEIGDLSAIKVEIQISDRDLTQFAQGQRVNVSLDAFPGETFAGEVTRISPVADAAARLIPIEITIPNPEGKIATGLLARVSVDNAALTDRVMVPADALMTGNNPDQAILFVPITQGDTTTAQARPVQIGNEDNGMVEIRSGLSAGERYIVKSDRPLETGQTVRLSLLSE